MYVYFYYLINREASICKNLAYFRDQSPVLEPRFLHGLKEGSNSFFLIDHLQWLCRDAVEHLVVEGFVDFVAVGEI